MRFNSHVPDGWRVVRLGDLASIRKQQITPSPGDARPYVALEHIESGGALIGYGRASDSISNKTVFHDGDTLYGKLRPNLRKVVRAEFDGICSTDIIAVFNGSGADSGFLSHLLRSDAVHRHAMQGVAGTKMPRTSWNHLSGFRFPVPPIKEQRAIAAILDSIDEAIERTDEVIAATERLRDALLHDLLTRGLPGRHTDFKRVRGLGTIPTTWDVARLGDVAEVVGGSTPARSKPECWGGDIPWVVPSEITELRGRHLTSTRESITSKGMQSTGLRLIPPGSVLLTTRATIGATAINAIPVTTNQGFQNLIPGPETDGTWLYYWATAMKRELEKRGAGSTFREVSRDGVGSMRIGVPPLGEQKAIASSIESIDQTLVRNVESLDMMKSLKSSTADSLLTGRSRTNPDTENI